MEPSSTRRVATSEQDVRPPESSRDARVPREWFAGTLAGGRSGVAGVHWLFTPLGAAIHGFAVCGLIVATLWSNAMPLEHPSLPLLVLQLAPPPPPAPSRGIATGAREPVVAAPRSLPTASAVPSIPAISENVLAARFDAPLGIENGFDDGDPDGMPGGMPGGVLGGVPGGLVGGEVGGTGTALPRFPRPDVGPSPIQMPQPSYTKDAIRNNVEGAVVLRVVIDERGKVEVLKVLRSVPELDEEAIRVVESRWRFQPATKNGRPVPTLSDLVVRFRLY